MYRTCSRTRSITIIEQISRAGGPAHPLRISAVSLQSTVFKPGACSLRQHAPGFLKLLWFVHRYVCVSAPEAINNQWRDMV